MESRLNLKWYNPDHVYSDGDIEEEIYQLLSSGKTEKDLLREDDRWPILYHFSPDRQNVVRFLPVQKTDSVLEIGSGMGAITKALCEKAKSVTCVDLSLQRCKVNALRNQSQENLEVIVANINAIPFRKKFDWVTLVGVLEYSGCYTNGENPYLDFLKKALSLVRVGGHLVIAIENRMGLKYFAGAKEDHYGKPFVGLDGYLEDRGIRTFSLPEIKELLAKANCDKYELFLPFPDYKFAYSIVSADEPAFFPGSAVREQNFGAYTTRTFNQKAVYTSLIEQGDFAEFANSFLLVIERPKA